PLWLSIRARRVHASPHRLAQKTDGDRQEEARQAHEGEAVAPPPPCTEPGGDEVCESSARRNGQVEDGEGSAALLDGEQIRQERGRDRPEGRLTDPDHPSRQKEPEIGGGQSRGGGGGAPQNGPQGEDPPPREAVAQVSEDGGGQKIDQEEEGPEEAESGVADGEVLPDQGLDRGDDVPIQIVEKIETGQEPESIVGM